MKPQKTTVEHKTRCDGGKRRGSTVVEFALIVPIVIAILLAILESAWLSRNYLAIANATREGARTAALGRSTTVIRTRVVNAAAPVTVVAGDVTLQYSTDNGANYVTMGDTGTSNNAPAGSMVRVTVTRQHQSLTRFFPFLNNRTVTIRVVMRREAT